MYRSVITMLVLALLVTTIFIINPEIRDAAAGLWIQSQPALVAWKDKALEMIRVWVGNSSDSNSDPGPGSPDINIDVIAAFDRNDSLCYAPSRRFGQ